MNKKIKYEHPGLVLLNPRGALGLCSNGSGAGPGGGGPAECMPNGQGATASPDCFVSGLNANSVCTSNGSSATETCSGTGSNA